MRIRFMLFFVLLFIFSLFAGEEVLLNSAPEKNQRDPEIATDGNGNMVVVWTLEDSVSGYTQKDIYLQRMTALLEKQGPAKVNSYDHGNQENPAVAMNGEGRFVVVWAHYSHPDSMYDVMAQLYDDSGATGESFVVNSHIDHSQQAPAVDMAANGEFTVVWESWNQDGDDRGVYAQRFDADGRRIGDEFLVNSTTAYSQAKPRIAYGADGQFLVIWESWNQDEATPSGYGLFGRLFDAKGQKLGSEFQINTYTNDYQWFGDVVALDDSGFMVVWCSWEQDGDDGGIYMQRFDAEGQKIGAEIPVNKTTRYYQWLPRIAKLHSGDIAVIWSSWKQDGNREGVYCRFFSAQGEAKSFETKINLTTESYQWEPVVAAVGADDIVAVWSSWAQFSDNYDIVARTFTPDMPVGTLDSKSINNKSGITTSQLIVHVMDQSALKGDPYELFFYGDSSSADLFAEIVNLKSGQTVITDFPLNRGSGYVYRTPVFEGIAVEIIPVFELGIDLERSRFVNNSSSNVTIEIKKIIDSRKNVAPVDAAIQWGSTDTLANGEYSSPLDTALFDVVLPFKARDLTQNQPLDIWVIEESGTKNKRWDPNEPFRIITPPPYQERASDSHVEIEVVLPPGDAVLPGIGDTLFVYTKRPLTLDDTLGFIASQENMVTEIRTNKRFMPDRFRLEQNYPNPFNPRTTIPYYLRKASHVELKVFNIMGQHVADLVCGKQAAGQHKILFNAGGMANGVYFYTLSLGRERFTRKMLLMK